jgi:hypothetical protein
VTLLFFEFAAVWSAVIPLLSSSSARLRNPPSEEDILLFATFLDRVVVVVAVVVAERLLRVVGTDDDARGAETKVREERSRGSTRVFDARRRKLCPDRSIFWSIRLMFFFLLLRFVVQKPRNA